VLLLNIVLLSLDINVSLLRMTSGLAFEGFNTFKSLKEFDGYGVVIGWVWEGWEGWVLKDSLDEDTDWLCGG
jgi:hypothetical protein